MREGRAVVRTHLGQAVESALDAGEGILRLVPTWVPRDWLVPGGRLKLAREDRYPFGVVRGGICERWLASTVPADNGPLTRPDEGLSYVVSPDGETLLLRDALANDGERLLGAALWTRAGRWPVLTKFFDNQGPVPFHLHQRAEHVSALGREPKPEAYYFPPQLNADTGRLPISFFGLHPNTRPSDVRACLERWHHGDNGVLNYARGFWLQPGTGWLIQPGILHSPGTMCTYEVQWASDVLAMFQSVVDDRAISWDLVIKDVPDDQRDNLDYIVSLVDWQANTESDFKQAHYLEPRPATASGSEGLQDRWVIYGDVDGESLFSAREISVQPGVETVLADDGPCGVIAVQGRGTIGPLAVEATSHVRFGQPTFDEFFVTAPAAQAGVRVRCTGHEPLVLLRHIGPRPGHTVGGAKPE